MTFVEHLATGFAVALSIQNVAYCLFGVLIGTLIGVLPGIGPLATIAMLLPLTYGLPAEVALIMLAGVYYGAMYGGSTTAILVNMPGESASVVTCLDGYQLARQGRAGTALAISALGSFVAGCLATLLIALLAPPLALVAFEFGSVEYFSLMAFGLVAAVVLSRGSLLKGVGMILLGLLFGIVGSDLMTGTRRFTFGIALFDDGIDFIPLAMGTFGVAEVLANLQEKGVREVVTRRVRGLWPSRTELRAATWPVLRGTAIGSALGVLPGGGAILSSFASYTLEKRLSRDPTRFGRGAIEGVAGPESANNAGAQTSFIPLLTLGIPGNAVMAVMIGAMVLHGIQPGPHVMRESPELFWGLIASMWVGNLMLVVLNLPLIGIWVRLLLVPYRLLFPAILVFACIGVYSVHGNAAEVLLLPVFGLMGYLFTRIDCDPAPLLLGFVLGPLMEENLRRSMLISRGDPTVFLTHPISLAMLVLAVALLVLAVVPALRSTRGQAFREE